MPKVAATAPAAECRHRPRSEARASGDKVAIRDPLTLSGAVAMWPLVRGAAISFP